MPLLQANIDEAMLQKDYGLAAQSLITQADIHLQKQCFRQGGATYQYCAALPGPYTSERYRHFQDLYTVLVKLSAARGDAEPGGGLSGLCNVRQGQHEPQIQRKTDDPGIPE